MINEFCCQDYNMSIKCFGTNFVNQSNIMRIVFDIFDPALFTIIQIAE